MFVAYLVFLSIPAHKSEQLQDFLSKLFEPPPDLQIPRMPSVKLDLKNLHTLFASVMTTAKDYGYIERALKSS